MFELPPHFTCFPIAAVLCTAMQCNFWQVHRSAENAIVVPVGWLPIHQKPMEHGMAKVAVLVASGGSRPWLLIKAQPHAVDRVASWPHPCPVFACIPAAYKFNLRRELISVSSNTLNYQQSISGAKNKSRKSEKCQCEVWHQRQRGKWASWNQFQLNSIELNGWHFVDNCE